MTAGQFLGSLSLVHSSAWTRPFCSRLNPWSHLLATDDASALVGKLLGSRVRVTSIHVLCRISVLHEIVDSLDKRPDGEEKVAHDVNRYSMECYKDCEEAAVYYRFDEVFAIVSPFA
jgi:hypothetical protein